MKTLLLQSPDGDYVGELNCSSGFRQGWGEMRWANGSLYGPNNIFVYSQGDRYYGQWDMDRQEGNNPIPKCVRTIYVIRLK